MLGWHQPEETKRQIRAMPLACATFVQIPLQKVEIKRNIVGYEVRPKTTPDAPRLPMFSRRPGFARKIHCENVMDNFMRAEQPGNLETYGPDTTPI
jgi:hypothetical protein